MERGTMDTQITKVTDDQKHLVMLIWGFRANRNAAEVARLLSTDEYREIGLDGISRQSVATWAREGKWAGLVDRELYREAPVQRYRTQAELILGAPEAARLLRDVLNMDDSLMVDKPYVTVDKNTGEVSTTIVREYDEKLLKVRLEAAKVILDRTGFSPVGTRDVGNLDTPPEIEADATEDSDEDWDNPQWVAEHTAREYARLGKQWVQVESGKAHKRAGG